MEYVIRNHTAYSLFKTKPNIMLKNRIFIITAFLCISLPIIAQNRDTDKRTTATIIADLLAKMPAVTDTRFGELMQEMAAFGEEELVSIAGMLASPGQGDDSRVRFAMNGFSHYVMQEGMGDKRKVCIGAWCKALDQAKDNEIKAFLISQLQIMGTNEAVLCLAGYLNDARLCDPAARALVTISSSDAGAALLKAMENASDAQLLSLVQALGDIRNENAADALSKLANSQDPSAKKTALYALGNIGSERSGEILYQEARRSGYRFDPSNATAAYLLWLDRTGEKGNPILLKKRAVALIKESLAGNQVQSATEALALLAKYTGEKSMPRLLAASGSSHSAYRNASLEISNTLSGEKVTQAWIKKAGKLKDQPKAEVVAMLGNRGDQAAFNFILSALSDPEKPVRMAAITAAQKLGQSKALPDLLEFLKKADADEINTLKQAICSMHGQDVVSSVGKAMPGMASQPKIAMMEVIAARRAAEFLPAIQEQVNSGDPAVKSAALEALPSLVSEKDLPGLFTLLKETDRAKDLNAVQKAVISAMQGVEPVNRKAGLVIRDMNKSEGPQQSRYYAILRDIGGKVALEEVMKAFSKGAPENRQSAFKALTSWKDASACHDLYSIFAGSDSREFVDSTFNAYVRLVMNSGHPDEQKLLLLRKAMEASPDADLTGQALADLGNVNILTSLLFAGRYLDDPKLQHIAARSVMRIALADTSLTGNLVSGLLQNAMGKLTGSESNYDREAIRKRLTAISDKPGFVPLFNGKDLSGWKGLVENPVTRAKMTPEELEKKQIQADEIMHGGWSVYNGSLIFNGKGENLCTSKAYGDFEMFVDWKIMPGGDAGIYLRGSPQVQIWDASRIDTDAKVGSGGLYNNEIHESKPLKTADNPVGEWNTFRILMQGERVTVYLNGQLVVDNTIMENYWDRSIPIFRVEQIELQAHGSLLAYRDIYIREIPRPEPYRISDDEKAVGFRELFDGISLFNWTGNMKDYQVKDGAIAFVPNSGGSGNLYTREEYGNFVFRFDFQLTPAGNSGIGVRTSPGGDAAYVGMEIQVLDDGADVYKNLKPYQYHGSVYGIIPARRGFLEPVGEWNSEEIMFQGSRVKVILNGTVIVDGDIAEASKDGTIDHLDHPGLKNAKGHIGFLSHDSPVKFRNIRIKVLD